jgi:cell wall-associated NlpC family hydrolase
MEEGVRTTVASHPGRPKRPRALLTLLLSLIASVAVLLAGGTAVRADPTVSQLEKQIDEAWMKLEPVLEEHNATKIKLKQQRDKVKQLQAKIVPLQLQYDLAMDQVSQFATYLYVGGETSAVNALISSGTPEVFAQQLETLDQFARMQADSVDVAVKARLAYEDQKRPLDALVTNLSDQEKQEAADEKKLDGEIEKLQAAVTKLYGSTTQLGDLRPAPCPYTYPGGKAGIAVKYACAQISKRYVWGTAGPDTFDCSGLMLAAWAKAGIYLPHNAAAQRRSMPYIKEADLRPGDFVFYYSDIHHVGMYVGGGWIVHASMAGVPIKMRRLHDAPVHSYGRPVGA